MYNPKAYWQARKKPNESEDIPEFAKDYITCHLQGEMILDYGPGTGRLFGLYEGKTVIGVDFVDTYREQAIRRARELGLRYTHWIKGLESVGMQFDCAVASKVLLHVLPNEIESVMKHLNCISDKVIVWDMQCEDPQPHNFSHPYEELVQMRDVVREGKELLFWY